MHSSKSVLMVGVTGKTELLESLLEKENIAVTRVDGPKSALEELEKTTPDAIIFVIPVYIKSVTDFVSQIRQKERFENTPIISVSNIIEGADLQVLHSYGVKTLSLGPVPEQEMVRFIKGVIENKI